MSSTWSIPKHHSTHFPFILRSLQLHYFFIFHVTIVSLTPSLPSYLSVQFNTSSFHHSTISFTYLFHCPLPLCTSLYTSSLSSLISPSLPLLPFQTFLSFGVSSISIQFYSSVFLRHPSLPYFLSLMFCFDAFFISGSGISSHLAFL